MHGNANLDSLHSEATFREFIACSFAYRYFKTNADGHEDDDDDDHVNDEDDVDDDIIHICMSLYHNRTVPHDCDKVCHVVKISFLLCLIIQGAMRNLPQQCSDVVEDRAQ